MRSTLPLVVLLLALTACTVRTTRGSGGARPVPPPGGAPGSTGALVLRVVPVQPAPLIPGRLIVLWAPIGDDDRGFLPELGYDTPFYGTERSVAIPYAAVVPPRRLQSFPACLDHQRPECNRLAGVATGYVLVVPNRAGPVDPLTAAKGETHAVGRVILGFGTMPIAAGGPLRDVFPGGIAQGMAPYGLARPPGSSFDRMWLAPSGAGFDLVACTAANPQCDLPFPNLN